WCESGLGYLLPSSRSRCQSRSSPHFLIMSNSRSILLVDDEVNVARTLQMVFEQEGYTVTAAYSAREALQSFKDGLRTDVVITDLNMERDDIGLEVARAAQKLKPRPLVVICTGYATVENSSSALEMRVD